MKATYLTLGVMGLIMTAGFVAACTVDQGYEQVCTREESDRGECEYDEDKGCSGKVAVDCEYDTHSGCYYGQDGVYCNHVTRRCLVSVLEECLAAPCLPIDYAGPEIRPHEDKAFS